MLSKEILTYAAVALAAVVALWPQILWALKTVKLPSFKPASTSVGYQDSLVALAAVRRRLDETETMADDVNAAIELITHALVQGSAK
jgi:Na+-translocating ferredoxin:NAD+ oxidoreductase RnfA subunit